MAAMFLQLYSTEAMDRAGTMRVLKRDVKSCVARWTIDDFLGRTKKYGYLRSPTFCFRASNFYLMIPDSFGREPYKPEVHVNWAPGGIPPGRFYWKFSLENRAGSVFEYDKDVETEQFYCIRLRPLKGVRRFLHPDGSLVLLWEFRHIPNGTFIFNLRSLFMQYPEEEDPEVPKIVLAIRDHVKAYWKYFIPSVPSLTTKSDSLSTSSACGTTPTSIPSLTSTQSNSSSTTSLSCGTTPSSVPSLINTQANSSSTTSLACASTPSFVPSLASTLASSSLTTNLSCASTPKESEIPGVCSLSEDIEKMFDNAEYSDAVVKCGDRIFHVNRNILSIRSDVFAALFRNKISENLSKEVSIVYTSPTVVEQFLRYIYSGRLGELSTELALELYVVADRYAVPSLKQHCMSFLIDSITEETMCEILSLAYNFKHSELLAQIVSYIAEQPSFFKSNKWVAFIKSHCS